MPRRTRPSSQPRLPFLAPAAAVPTVRKAVPPPQSFASLVRALATAWDAGDWDQIHALIDVLRDREESKEVRYIPGRDHDKLYFAIGHWYWRGEAEYWQAQAEAMDQAIETVIDRLGDLWTYAAGEGEQQQYMAYLREHGYPEVAPWDTDPAWFANPDVIGFVCDTLESTPYYFAKVRRANSATKSCDTPPPRA